jgi:hypothetical protein
MTYDACYCDYDQPEFWSCRTSKARKTHRCCECRSDIRIGECYETTAGKWEGDFSVYKTCQRCAELRQWAIISVPCFCWYYGDLHENVRDMVSEVHHDVPGLIYEWGRRMIGIERHRYDRHWPRQRASR